VTGIQDMFGVDTFLSVRRNRKPEKFGEGARPDTEPVVGTVMILKKMPVAQKS